MPGSVTTVSGLIERQLGRGVVAQSALQRFGKGGALMAGGGNITCSASQAGFGNGNDTTEDTLVTMTLPPNSLDVANRQVFLEAYGSITATSATKNARIYFGSTLLVTFTGTTTQTGVWAVMATITKTGAGQQTALILNDTTITGSLVRSITTASPSESDTAGIVIKVTGQVSAGGAAIVLCNALTVCGYN